MANFPDLKLMADINSLEIYAKAISQGASQLINASDRTTPAFMELKEFTLKTILDLKEIVNKVEIDIV